VRLTFVSSDLPCPRINAHLTMCCSNITTDGVHDMRIGLLRINMETCMRRISWRKTVSQIDASPTPVHSAISNHTTHTAQERNLEHFLFCACARKHTGAEALLAFLKAYIPFGKYAPKAVNAHKGGCGVLNKHHTGVPLREFIGLCQADV